MATLQGLQGWCFWVLFLFFYPNPQDDFGVFNTAKQNSDYRTNMCLDRLNGFDEALWWWCSVEYVFFWVASRNSTIQDDDAKFKSMERNAINSQKGPEKLRDAKQRTTSFAAAGPMCWGGIQPPDPPTTKKGLWITYYWIYWRGHGGLAEYPWYGNGAINGLI